MFTRYVFSLALFYFATSAASPADTRLQRSQVLALHLSRSVTVRYEVKDGTVEIRGDTTDISMYDSNGNCHEEWWSFRITKRHVFTHVYEYDGANNLIREVGYDESGAMSSESRLTFDSANNMREEHDYESDGTAREQKYYVWDSARKCSSIVRCAANGDTLQLTAFWYDAMGRDVKQIDSFCYMKEDPYSTMTERYYDHNSKLAMEQHYGRDGLVRVRDVYDYDMEGCNTRHMGLQHFENEMLISMDESKYDQNHLITEKAYYDGGNKQNAIEKFFYEYR